MPVPTSNTESAAEVAPAPKPHSRFQFSLRALCILILVVAVLLALPGLTELLPWPLPIFVKIVFFVGIAFFWVTFFIVTVENVFSYMLYKPQNWPSPWPWLEMAAIALLGLLPVVSFLVRAHEERQLPNGYEISSGAHPGIVDRQGAMIVPGRIESFEIQDDLVMGQTVNGTYFVLETASGRQWTSDAADLFEKVRLELQYQEGHR